MRARFGSSVVALALAASTLVGPRIAAAQDGPEMTVPNLGVSPVVSGLVTPTSMAFLGW